MKVNRHAKIIELINNMTLRHRRSLRNYLNQRRLSGDTGNGIQRYQRSEAYKSPCGRLQTEIRGTSGGRKWNE